MMWASWGDFWAMGGYGLYVWGSYAMVALVVVVEMRSAVLRQRRAVAQINEQQEDTDL
jgi:heme exporter protein D